MQQDYDDPFGNVIYGYPDEHPYYDDEVVAPYVPPVGVGTLPEPATTPGPSPAPTPTPTPTPRVPGTTSYPIAGGQTFFSYPDWAPPDVQFDDWTAPSWDVAPFEYPDFVGPTADTFQADPGYEFRAKEMERAVLNAKSAQGLLSTGGTLAELMSYRGGLASQEFGNVWNRQFQTYDTNRRNALENWRTGYQSETDEYSRALTSYLTQQEAKAQQWNRSRDLYSTNLSKEAATYGLNLDTSNLNLARDTAGFSNLLSLYGLMTRSLPTYSATA